MANTAFLRIVHLTKVTTNTVEEESSRPTLAGTMSLVNRRVATLGTLFMCVAPLRVLAIIRKRTFLNIRPGGQGELAELEAKVVEVAVG
jgi:hypothetical protein